MLQLTRAPALTMSVLPCSLLLATSLLAGCGGGSGGASTNAAAEQPRQPDTENPAPTPEPGPEPAPEPQPLNRFQFANGCYTLNSDGRFLQADTTNSVYTLTRDAAQATAFTLKPTDLGRYLLVSDYQRTTGSSGQKQLLGISDPAGELLDQSGNFVGELSYLVAGLGDTLNLVLDPVAPLGGLLRELGESLEGIGDTLGDTTLQPSLAMVSSANDLAVWNLNPSEGDSFTLASQVTGLLLTASDDGLTLTSPSLENADTRFVLNEAEGCSGYPEAELSATVADSGPLSPITTFQGNPALSSANVVRDALDGLDTQEAVNAATGESICEQAHVEEVSTGAIVEVIDDLCTDSACHRQHRRIVRNAERETLRIVWIARIGRILLQREGSHDGGDSVRRWECHRLVHCREFESGWSEGHDCSGWNHTDRYSRIGGDYRLHHRIAECFGEFQRTRHGPGCTGKYSRQGFVVDRQQRCLGDHLDRFCESKTVDASDSDAVGETGRFEELRTSTAVESRYRSRRGSADGREQIGIMTETKREAGGIGRESGVSSELGRRDHRLELCT